MPATYAHAAIGRPLLGKGSVNTPKIIRDNRSWCLPWGPPQGYTTKSSKVAVSCCQKLREFIWVCCFQEFGTVLEMVVEGDWEEMQRRLSVWSEVTDCYKSIVVMSQRFSPHHYDITTSSRGTAFTHNINKPRIHHSKYKQPVEWYTE
jgi:hypothetical protein